MRRLSVRTEPVNRPLLKLLAGGVHPLPLDETRISLFGEEGGNVWDVRKRIGIVSHDLQRDYLICAEGLNVILSGYYASNDTYGYQEFTKAQVARAHEVMKELGIESLTGRRFGHLSTGEQRRFLLGRALVHDPLMLVLDEPTSGLDVKACFQYLDLLRAQISKGKTALLLVTHHLHEIPPEIERVLLLKEAAKSSPTVRKADLLINQQNQQPLSTLPIVSLAQSQRLVSSLAGVTACRVNVSSLLLLPKSEQHTAGSGAG